MKFLLVNYQSPGDLLILTSLIKALKEYNSSFVIGVDTSCPEIFENNPYISDIPFSKNGDQYIVDSDTAVIKCDYFVESSNYTNHHFITAFIDNFNTKFGYRLQPIIPHGQIFLSHQEKNITHFKGIDLTKPYWLLNAGGKFDFTVKWWPPEYYGEVIYHFKDKIKFIQVGEKNHWHVVHAEANPLVGQTTLRDLVVLMYRAQGYISPVSFLNHLSAAVKPHNKQLNIRPGIVIAGGAEPVNWEYYNGTQYLHTVGCYDCNQNGGCWKSKVVPITGKEPAHTLCQYPTETPRGLMISRCMYDIKPKDVIRAIERYYEGGVLKYAN